MNPPHVPTVSEPAYLRSFTCIGGACEDSCCRGWNIDVDADALKRFQSLVDSPLAPLLGQHLETRNLPAGAAFPARIGLDASKSCPFLDAAGFCSMQNLQGESFLALVCARYPRTINRLCRDIERSASVSCPEIARLALLNPEPMTFLESPVDPQQRDLLKLSLADDAARAELRTMRSFIFPLLQNRSYSLSERLIVLGTFCRKVQDLPPGTEAAALPEIIASLNALLAGPDLKHMLADIPASPLVQTKLLTEIVGMRNASGSLSPRYIACFESFLRGLHYEDAADMDVLCERYVQAYSTYARPFLASHEHVFENYLVNLAFRELFPCQGSVPLFDSYIMLVLHYSLMRMLLIGMAADNKGLDAAVTITLIQSFARVVGHQREFLDKILAALKKAEMDSLAYVTILLKLPD